MGCRQFYETYLGFERIRPSAKSIGGCGIATAPFRFEANLPLLQRLRRNC